MPPKEANTVVYYIKRVKYKGSTRPIILQNENGPCPLLAICNALFLRGSLDLHPDYQSVDTGYLLELLGDYLMESNPLSADPAIASNQQQNLADVIAQLSTLEVGLDINVKFTHVRAFEYTPQMVIFDLASVELLHGWVVDPQDADAVAAVGELSYNQLSDKLVNMQITLTEKDSAAPPAAPLVTSPPPPGVGAGATEDGAERTGDTAPEGLEPQGGTGPEPATSAAEAADVPVAVPSEPKARSESTDTRVIKEGTAIENFLHSTASQMTFHGLFELHGALQEGQLCVLFRNNHFSTMTKHDNVLFTLATDEGYLLEENLVWEMMGEVEGDSCFVDGDFRTFRKHSDPAPARPNQATAAVGGTSVAMPGATQAPAQTADEADFQLAMRLQQEEQAAAEQYQLEQQQRQQRQVREQQERAADQQRRAGNRNPVPLDYHRPKPRSQQQGMTRQHAGCYEGQAANLRELAREREARQPQPAPQQYRQAPARQPSAGGGRGNKPKKDACIVM